VVVSLALAIAGSRLRMHDDLGAVASVRGILWDTAMRIEQGDVPLAERQLEDARKALLDALHRGASQSEIERLMDALQQALDRYLAAAAAAMARGGQTAMPLDPRAQMLRSEDLKDLIETARQLSRSGGREGAMRMLAELQRALDGIRSGLRSGGTRPDVAEAQALMKSLRSLAERQRDVLDETYQRLRDTRGSNGRPGEKQGERGTQKGAEKGPDRGSGTKGNGGAQEAPGRGR
jgi:hypothetical protein